MTFLMENYNNDYYNAGGPEKPSLCVHGRYWSSVWTTALREISGTIT